MDIGTNRDMSIKFDIKSIDESLRAAVSDMIDNLNKPRGSLGMLETVAAKICLIQHSLRPCLKHPCHLLFGADHGIEREHVSASPREVTWQQMINFTRGGAAVNMFCRQHGFDLRIIDIGVDHDLSAYPEIVNRKIANGTRDFLYEPAMDATQYVEALNAGIEQVDIAWNEGSNIVCIGEMGIANTSAASVWMHLLTRLPLADCIGTGSGIGAEGLKHKRQVLERAVMNFRNGMFSHQKSHVSSSEMPCLRPVNAAFGSDKCGIDDVETVLSHFGGFEMVAAVGAMLRAAEHGMIVMVDGFIMSACMLAASRLCPEVLQYAIFGHCGSEQGHRKLLDYMGAKPLLSLQMRLGEGTGALCAYPLIDSAVRMVNEMNTFKGANITKYF